TSRSAPGPWLRYSSRATMRAWRGTWLLAGWRPAPRRNPAAVPPRLSVRRSPANDLARRYHPLRPPLHHRAVAGRDDRLDRVCLRHLRAVDDAADRRAGAGGNLGRAPRQSAGGAMDWQSLVDDRALRRHLRP